MSDFPKEAMDVGKEKTGSCVMEEKMPGENDAKETENQLVNEEMGDEEPLSKSAIKKREKMRKLQEYWKEKKKLKKQQKKEKAKMAKREPAKDDNLTPEEKARLKEMRLQERAKWLEDLKTSPRVLIDLDFQELMRPNEISSLTQQVMYSYGFIRRAKRPLRLVLTSVKDEIKTKLEKIQGFHSWLVGSLSFRNEQIEQYEASVSEVNTTVESFHYPNDKMVYLSADADETITELEDDKVYIIGGIVDRNRYKNLTLNKAKQLGYRCAKLPLELVRFHGSRVLTVNNVVELLVRFHNDPNWEQVIKEGVPMRKVGTEEEQ
ncbi:hypothetical protein WA577_007834 [Blastocystis sp. JDR]